MHGASVNIADLDGVSPLLASVESIGSEGQSMEMEHNQERQPDIQAALVPDKGETVMKVDHRIACLQPIPKQCADMLPIAFTNVVSLPCTYML